MKHSKRFDDDCLYIIQIINPYTNDDYILRNSINEIVAFEDRFDAIDYTKRHVRRIFYTEYYRIYIEPMWVIEGLSKSLSIIRKVKNKE